MQAVIPGAARTLKRAASYVRLPETMALSHELWRIAKAIERHGFGMMELEGLRQLGPAAVAAEAATGQPVATRMAADVLRRTTMSPDLSSKAEASGAKILWVDDHPENNTYEVEVLRRAGRPSDRCFCCDAQHRAHAMMW